MKSREYWLKRFEELEKASNNIGLSTYAEIEPVFIQAERNIQSQIESWYSRFAANNNVTLSEARKMLNSKEISELKWDVNQFIKYGEKNALDKQWMKELENASAKFHISRLEALKLRIQQAMEVAFSNEVDSVDKMARNILTEDYYKSIFEVQKGFNVGWEIGQIDERKLNLLVNKPWATDGKNFSSRIWERKQQMVSELQQELTRTLIQGKSPDEAIKHMTKFVQGKVKNAKNAAGRLVMTEQAYFHSVSQKEAFNDLDVEEFEIVATLDSHTSEICQEMDGKHFPMDEYSPGVTAPPFHVWCRSVTCPYFNDEWSIGERAARGADGKTYYVPSDMKYKQWKEKFVSDSISKKTKEEFEKYRKILGGKVLSIEEFVKIKYNKDEFRMFKAYTSLIKSGELSALADFDLYKNISKEMDDKLLGVITSNGMTITGKSNHSIARVIGSVEQRRNGVQVSDVLDALTNIESEVLPVRTFKNGRSQKFRNGIVEVTVNPETGNIIQVNPVHRRKKVKS